MNKEPTVLLTPSMNQPPQQLFSWTNILKLPDHHLLESPISKATRPASEIEAVSQSPSLKVSPMVLERVASSVSPSPSADHNTSTQPIGPHIDHAAQFIRLHSPSNGCNTSAEEIRTGAIESEESHRQNTTFIATEDGAFATTGQVPARPIPLPPASKTASPSTSVSTETRPKPPKSKRALFDGVVITSRPRQKHASSSIPHARPPPPPPASTAAQNSLVDALQFTFDANKQQAQPSRQALLTSDDESVIAAQILEREQEQGEAETDKVDKGRLGGPAIPSRPRRREVSWSVATRSESASEDAGVPVVSRPKRAKPVAYDAVAAVVDDALGTVVAPVRWDDTVVEDAESASRAGEWGVCRDAMSDVSMDSTLVPREGGERGRKQQPQLQPLGGSERGPVPRPSSVTSLIAATSNVSLEPTSALLPHVPMGDRFWQKLYHIFGENATVRMDRGARPRATSYDIYEPLHTGHLGASSPSPPSSSEEEDKQEGGILSDPAQAGAEAGTLPIPTVENGATSDIPSLARSSSTSRPSLKRRASQELDAESLDDIHASSGHSERAVLNDLKAASNRIARKKKRRLALAESEAEQWILSFQRLIKGKVRFTEEALEELSTILGDIDAIKEDFMDSIDIPIMKTLRKTIHQVAELPDIPFGDTYMLRKRARLIALHWK